MGDHDIEDVVADIWPGMPLTISALEGGITNRNFKVDLGEEAYVVRIAGSETALLGIDRGVEAQAARRAASLGVGPEVVAGRGDEGYLVTRFVAGLVGTPELLKAPQSIDEIARLLQIFHSGPGLASTFDPFQIVGRYREIASSRGVEISRRCSLAIESVDRIKRSLSKRAAVPCHNDLLPGNFILGQGRIWLIDWEYAAMGDPYFDLANVSINNDFGAPEIARLLLAYCGSDGVVERRELALMQYVSLLREAMWGVVQQGISTLEFDFEGYAGEHLDRLEQLVHKPELRAVLG
ncbi:MAG: phosphotransferase [Acidimicrobiales bacterium]